jgi:RimJ/RimL family protein N-acetyltransferase
MTTHERRPDIVLRRFSSEDVPIHLNGEDAAISKWLSGGVSTEETVRRWFESNEENWSNDGPRFVFAIETQGGQLAGMIEVNVDYAHFAGLEPGDANISYGLYPLFRGRGLAASALTTVEVFMRSKRVRRGVIRVEKENLDSVALAERCGYVRTGTVVNGAGTQYTMFLKELAVERR